MRQVKGFESYWSKTMNVQPDRDNIFGILKKNGTLGFLDRIFKNYIEKNL